MNSTIRSLLKKRRTDKPLLKETQIDVTEYQSASAWNTLKKDTKKDSLPLPLPPPPPPPTLLKLQKPTTVCDRFFGNESRIKLAMKVCQEKRMALLHGPDASGRTTLVKHVQKQMKWKTLLVIDGNTYSTQVDVETFLNVVFLLAGKKRPDIVLMNWDSLGNYFQKAFLTFLQQGKHTKPLMPLFIRTEQSYDKGLWKFKNSLFTNITLYPITLFYKQQLIEYIQTKVGRTFHKWQNYKGNMAGLLAELEFLMFLYPQRLSITLRPSAEMDLSLGSNYFDYASVLLTGDRFKQTLPYKLPNPHEIVECIQANLVTMCEGLPASKHIACMHTWAEALSWQDSMFGLFSADPRQREFPLEWQKELLQKQITQIPYKSNSQNIQSMIHTPSSLIKQVLDDYATVSKMIDTDTFHLLDSLTIVPDMDLLPNTAETRLWVTQQCKSFTEAQKEQFLNTRRKLYRKALQELKEETKEEEEEEDEDLSFSLDMWKQAFHS